MQNPRLLDRRPIPGELKAAQAIYSQWISFGPLRTINPGFGRIHDFLHDKAQGVCRPTEVQEWQLKQDDYPTIEWTEFARMLRMRYDVDYDDWVSCVRTLTSVPSFPCDWAHPVAWRLFQVDYG